MPQAPAPDTKQNTTASKTVTPSGSDKEKSFTEAVEDRVSLAERDKLYEGLDKDIREIFGVAGQSALDLFRKGHGVKFYVERGKTPVAETTGEGKNELFLLDKALPEKGIMEFRDYLNRKSPTKSSGERKVVD